jgi:uncharacterized protein
MFAADLENPWIVAALRAPRRAPPVLVAAGGVAIAGVLVVAGRAAAPAVGVVLANLIVFAGLAVVAVVATRREGRRLWPREIYGAGAVIGGLALGLGAVFAAVALASMAGAATVIISPPSAPLGVFAAAILVAALAAVAQEVFFRGWMQPVLCAACGAWPGLLFVAAIFAAFHVAAGVHGALVSVNLALASLLLGLLALRSGGLAASTAAHLAWIWTGFAGLSPLSAGRVVEVTLQGPALWSGGAQGPGGSLAVTAVLIALVLSLAMVKPQIVAVAEPQRPRVSRK